MSNNALHDEPRADGEAQAGQVNVEMATRLDDDAGALTLANLPDATLEEVLDAREAALNDRKPMGPPIQGEDESGNPITLSEQPSNSGSSLAMDDDNGAVEITPAQEQSDSTAIETQSADTSDSDSDDDESPEVTPTEQQ